MARTRRWISSGVLAVLVLGSTTAFAEVPRSRVVPPPPPEVRVDPAVQAARSREYRSARGFRSAGIALVAVGGTFLPLGIAMLVDASNNRATGRDVSGSRASTTLGSVLVAVGGAPLVIGLPMLVYGVSVKKPPMMPDVQIGLSRGALVWSF